MKKKTKFSRILNNPLSVIWILTVFACLGIGGEVGLNFNSNQKQEIVIADTIGLKDELLGLIFEFRIEHPEIVFAQAQLESAYFTSPVWKENNNMFGMKAAWNRVTTCIGVNKQYAVFKTWRDCLLDYALWQSVYAKGLTEEQYMTKLCSMYAEDEKYIIKLKAIIKK